MEEGEVEEEWNLKLVDDGLTSRTKLNGGAEPALWTACNLEKDDRRALLKFLIGKFPIPRNGARVTREPIKELATLVGQEKAWAPSLEKRVW